MKGEISDETPIDFSKVSSPELVLFPAAHYQRRFRKLAKKHGAKDNGSTHQMIDTLHAIFKDEEANIPIPTLSNPSIKKATLPDVEMFTKAAGKKQKKKSSTNAIPESGPRKKSNESPQKVFKSQEFVESEDDA